MRKIVMVIVLVVGMFVGSGYSEDFKSKKANSAVEKYNKAVSKAAVKCIKDLEKAKKSAVKKGDLDEATKIKEKIEELKNSNYYSGMIISAKYGAGAKTIDVKNILLKNISDGKIELLVHNDTFGKDPALLLKKMCTIVYIKNGKKMTIVVKEKDMIVIEFE